MGVTEYTQVKVNVQAELQWDACIDASHIAVRVDEGIVALSGHVRTFLEKHHAEQAAQRVVGVLAVANDIEVDPANKTITDPEIALSAIAALRKVRARHNRRLQPSSCVCGDPDARRSQRSSRHLPSAV